MAEGLVYDMFDEKLYVIKTLPGTFDRIFAGGDYGINNPTAFLLIGQKANDFYVIREYYYDSRKHGRQKTVSVEDFQSFIDNDQPEILFLDPSVAALILDLKEKGIKYVRGADNTVINGIQLVSNLLSNNGGRLFAGK
ncbi:hypothetical protein SMD22_17030 [Brevibacillus halotolerans]|nr:hypothetical protein SMD22_17030 [Brevibacillus halotolerans]